MSVDKSEQWLLNGKCTECRRKKYCSKPCRACKDRREYYMRNMVGAAIIKAMTGGYNER